MAKHIRFNKRAAKEKRDIRTGVVVDTKYGTGIVVYRDTDELVVALESDVMWCERYSVDVSDAEVSEMVVAADSRWNKGAWQHILDAALQMNIKYEIERSKQAIESFPNLQGVKVSERVEPTLSGSVRYRRLILDGVFDFEFDVDGCSLGLADKLAGAVAIWNGEDTTNLTVVDLSNKCIVRRKFEPNDIKYGEAYGWAKRTS